MAAMPSLDVNGARLHYEIVGSGTETIVFSHGLLMSGEMFRQQAEALGRHYRCILYDHRGQGRSEVTDGGYDMDTLAEDAVALIDQLDAAPCHFVGLSMGGFVGLRLAIRHPQLLRSLVLMDTSADPEPRRFKYSLMAWFGRWFGFRLLVKPVMRLMFGRSFLRDPGKVDARAGWRRHLLALDRIGAYRAARGVIDRESVYDALGAITVPTLVLVGDEDVATVPALAERIRAAIPHARLVVIPHAGHTTAVEQPEAVNTVIGEFFRHPDPGSLA